MLFIKWVMLKDSRIELIVWMLLVESVVVVVVVVVISVVVVVFVVVVVVVVVVVISVAVVVLFHNVCLFQTDRVKHQHRPQMEVQPST